MNLIEAMYKIEDYRARLQLSIESEILKQEDKDAHDTSARIMLIDEFLKKVDEGLGEPDQVAYTLYLKYTECMFDSMGKKASYMFEIMADEAGSLMDYFAYS